MATRRARPAAFNFAEDSAAALPQLCSTPIPGRSMTIPYSEVRVQSRPRPQLRTEAEAEEADPDPDPDPELQLRVRPHNPLSSRRIGWIFVPSVDFQPST